MSFAIGIKLLVFGAKLQKKWKYVLNILIHLKR